MEDNLRPWNGKCLGIGIDIRNEQLYILCFSDDQVVIAENEEDFNYMICKFQDEYQNDGLEINFKKTEYITNKERKDIRNLEIGINLEIKETVTSKYLGYLM